MRIHVIDPDSRDVIDRCTLDEFLSDNAFDEAEREAIEHDLYHHGAAAGGGGGWARWCIEAAERQRER